MTATAIIAIAFGLLELCIGGALLFARAPTEKALFAYPRHRLSGRLLLLIDAVWCAWLIYVTPFESLAWLKMTLYIFTPIAVYLVAVHLDDLLAPRALGGLFLLAATPLLRLIQWHDSSWHLVITVLIYIMLIKGMMLIMFPYKFRQAVEFCFAQPSRLGFVAGIALLLGACLLGLGFTVL